MYTHFDMSGIALLGLIAGGLTILSSLPQILHTIRSKKTSDISLPMYILLLAGICLWLIYGFITRQIAIIIPNGIYLVLNSIILVLKIKFG